jgi:hypothetical protein
LLAENLQKLDFKTLFVAFWLEMKDSFYFWKSLVLMVFFFTITPIALGVSMFSLLSLSKINNKTNTGLENQKIIITPRSGVKVFASLPVSFPSVSGQVTSADARPEIIRQYLDYWSSPLSPYSNYIVEIADKYQLDYRLTTAIAQQESNLCKIIPPGSYNCWGWGIHSEGTLGFSSFSEGIEEVSRGLREEYLNHGYSTIEEIMSKYTPLSNGSWANGVNKFLGEME